MSKEKQIEEIAIIISHSIQKWANDLPPISCPVYNAENIYNAGYRKQSEVIDEFAKRLLDAFPEGNRDARCPAIYYDDYRYIIEELAEEMKGGEADA